jgi:hypothetical protein
MGYACTGGKPPDDGNPTLVCTRGTPGMQSLEAGAAGAHTPVLYCCIPYGTKYSLCDVDRSAPGCGDQAYGFSCTGQLSPAQADPFLSCSDPVTRNGAKHYCCEAH